MSLKLFNATFFFFLDNCATKPPLFWCRLHDLDPPERASVVSRGIVCEKNLGPPLTLSFGS